MKELSELEQWFSIANSDYNIAEHIFNSMYPKPLEAVCFHCQQCAEKSLKGFLVFKETDFPKTHDLVKICNMCIELDKGFEKFLKMCQRLTLYATKLRYPDNMEVVEYDAKKALKDAKAIYDFCIEKVRVS